MRKFKCSICGYVYDEAEGNPGQGISPGTKWEDIPDDFVCPICSAAKSLFQLQEEKTTDVVASLESGVEGEVEKLKELSPGEIAAICTNLAKGCEKQRLNEEMEAFNKIAEYFKTKTKYESDKTLSDVAQMLDDDLTTGLAAANTSAKAAFDRGALRSLVWSEKVSNIGKSLLERFEKEGEAMLTDTKIFVCEICGFIYVGDTPLEICPVCKVPNFKIVAVERR